MSSEYRGSLGGVLAALGRDEEALLEYQEALRLVMMLNGRNSLSVAVASYFVAEQLHKMGRYADGLSVIEPTLGLQSATTQSLLLQVEAECLWGLGRTEEASISATTAVELARPLESRKRVMERLSTILAKNQKTYDAYRDREPHR